MLLPIHPHPLTDEILSCWMVRLAFDNGFGLHTFYKNVVGYRGAIWNRDIDRQPSQALIDLLSAQSGQPVEVIAALSLGCYKGLLFEGMASVGGSPWLLPVGVFHRTRRHAGMQYCPTCLRTDPIPYYRRHWRLAYYTICHLHRRPMLEACTNCQRPVAFHRHGIGRRRFVEINSLRYCPYCGEDMALAEPALLQGGQSTPASEVLMPHVGLTDGIDWQVRLQLPCALSFFQGLRYLIAVLLGGNGSRLRRQIAQRIGVEIGYTPHREFEKMGIAQRAPLMAAALWLIGEWPQRLLDVFASASFTRCRIAEIPGAVPYWLAHVIDENFDRRAVHPCEQEIFAAGLYLQRQGKKVTSGKLRRLMGLSPEYSRHAYCIWVSLNDATKVGVRRRQM